MITLPYPPAILSPNRPQHWAKKARAFREYKADCYFILHPFRAQLKGRDSYSLTFCPPDRRRRDLDNCLASAKALIDAISDMAGVDDSRFKLTIAKGEPVKGGAVVVT